VCAMRAHCCGFTQTYKLRSTEDIFAALEDNSVTLSTMKTSKYYLVFEQDVVHWEQMLALVSETVEIILQVW
jgi:dynein heavy chain, axonemal